MDYYNVFFDSPPLDQIAIVYQSEHVTYGELTKRINEFSEKIASFSENIFFISDDNVINTIVCLFGVLKRKKCAILVSQTIIESVTFDKLACNDSILIKNQEFIRIMMGKNKYSNSLEQINLLTSGTTGNPKICPLKEKVIKMKVDIIVKEFLDNYQDIVELLIFPEYSVTALLLQIFPTLLCHGKLLVAENLKQIPTFINNYKVTFMGLTPTLFNLLYRKNKNIFNDIENIFLGGEFILLDSIKKAALFLENTNLYVGYGLTEAAGAVAYGNVLNLPYNSVGKIMPGIEIKIVKNKTNHYHGEILLKNQYDDKWIETGDIGYIENNYLFLLDRKKNTVIVSGKNIFPNKIREKIMSIETIEDVYVYGEPCSTNGEAIVIDVITKMSIDELSIALKEKLLLHEFPKKINYVTALNIATSGKRKAKKNDEKIIK